MNAVPYDCFKKSIKYQNTLSLARYLTREKHLAEAEVVVKYVYVNLAIIFPFVDDIL